MKRFSLTLLAVIAAIAVYSVGCSRSSSSPSAPSAASVSAESQQDRQQEHAHHEERADDGDHEHHADATHDGQSKMEKMDAELAKLSPEDRASAEKQHFCPVSGEMLGTMGPPVKMAVKDQDVWICCNGCKDKLLADPDEYLAKLKQD